MQVHADILKKIKCYYCSCILSCGPILLSTTGKNVCGRCREPKKHEETFSRNTMYEELASSFLFPCQFNKDGCQELLKMEAVKKHEETCEYNFRRCPTSSLENRCSWNGNMEEIETHYKEKHSNLIVDHPYKVKPNITKSYMVFRAFNAFGYFFILQEKCDKLQARFWFNVVFIGPQKLAELFKYEYTLKKGNNRIFKKQNVQSNYLFIMHEEDSVVQHIKSIFLELGPYDETDLNISVTMKEVNCFKCNCILKSGPITLTSNGEYSCPLCYRNFEISHINTEYKKLSLREICTQTDTLATSDTSTQTQKIERVSTTERIRKALEKYKTIEEVPDEENKESPQERKQLGYTAKNARAVKTITCDNFLSSSETELQKCSECSNFCPIKNGLVCDDCLLIPKESKNCAECGNSSSIKTGLICNDCLSNSSKHGELCKNSNCTYRQSDISLLIKHSTWLCIEKNSACEVCSEVYTGTNYINHLVQHHSEKLVPKVVQTLASVDCVLSPGRKRLYFRVHGKLFLLRVAYSPNNIDIFIIVEDIVKGDDLFSVSYTISAANKGGLRGNLDACKKGRDWSKFINIQELELGKNDIVGFGLTIEEK